MRSSHVQSPWRVPNPGQQPFEEKCPQPVSIYFKQPLYESSWDASH